MTYHNREERQARDIWTALRNKYFEVLGIYYGDGISVDTDHMIYESDGTCYYFTIDSELETVEDIRYVTEQVFTKRYAEQEFYHWAIYGNIPMFKEIDGRLCARAADISIDRMLLEDTLAVKEYSDSYIIFKMKLKDPSIGKSAAFTLRLLEYQWLIDDTAII